MADLMKHLHLYRNNVIFDTKELAMAEFQKPITGQADGTPKLARYYADDEKTVVKTILGIYYQNEDQTVTGYTVYDQDSESAASVYQELLNEIQNRKDADDAEKAERQAIEGQSGATYTPNADAPYIGEAENMNDAEVKLAEALASVSAQTDAAEASLGLDDEGNFIPYSGSEYVKDAQNLYEAVEAIDHALSATDKKLEETHVWLKSEEEGEVAWLPNSKNQKIAAFEEDGTFKIWVEDEFMNVNDLVAQLAHETYGDETTVEKSVQEGEGENVTTDKTLKVAGSISKETAGPVKFSAPEIKFINLETENTRIVATVTDAGKFESTGLVTEGNLPKVASNSNAGMSIDGAEEVVITNGSYGMDGYNGIEIGLSADKPAPKTVTIKDVDFTDATFSNNAILIFATQDDAVINIKNCKFGTLSNPLRISNRTNATGVTVNVENCSVEQWDTDDMWAGFFICEDYTNKPASEANVFAPNKITINFKDLYYKGFKVLPENAADVLGTNNAETQVGYVWNNYEDGTHSMYVPYDENRYPTVTFA